MINSVADIDMVTFLDNFFTIGVVAAILSRRVMGQENTLFFIL